MNPIVTASGNPGGIWLQAAGTACASCVLRVKKVVAVGTRRSGSQCEPGHRAGFCRCSPSVRIEALVAAVRKAGSHVSVDEVAFWSQA